ncbi:AfsR/SARP family transcriptional regulator [Sphaerisporangium corydalis]|uniref:BTAD domain-containing putative transcriptional regulator n=1 Tax=Sphaerisporangium corydalis TaxID=1441875 RepID=A0ABV9ELD3_9ACTN|nr:BTAD domain-containing putative transcriptional regulator [Sphaerisporangium corydalis]
MSRFGVLGPLEVVYDGRPVPIPAAKQRVALATLLLEANRPVPLDRLIERIWEDGTTPEDARAAVQTHMARLRRTLGDGTGGVRLIDTRDRGYLIHAGPDSFDLIRFRDLAGRAARAGDGRAEAGLLRQALALWRGPVLGDVPSESLHRDEVPRLVEERLAALERWSDIGLALGDHDEVIAELRPATAEHPLRERLWVKLMLALHRSGRRAEALHAYVSVSSVLRQELGVDPGEELRRIHHAVLADEPDLVPAEHVRAGAALRPATPPRQLPPDIAHFTGREADLARLDALLPPEREPASVPPGEAPPDATVISVVSGMGGAGKTTLAVHWAHRVAARFPDGQLYLNLRGFRSRAPLEPGAALEMTLRALEVPSERIPDQVDARSALLRSVLAGRRVLMVLDDARDSAQVRPLLPGSGSLVLVTSRSRLGGLVARDGARPVTVGQLSPAESVGLLGAVLGRDRISAQPEAAADLANLCAHLPLALVIAAEHATRRPDVPLAVLAGELGDERTRLDLLDTEEDTESSLRAVFATSHREIGHQEALALELLATGPGPDIGHGAAACLIGLPRAGARRTMERLHGANLLQEHVPGRYRMHDLVQIYAAEQAGRVLASRFRTAALRRLADFYLHTAYAANRLIDPHHLPFEIGPPPAGCEPEPLTGVTSALAWFDAEHACLVAVHDLALDQGWYPLVWRLTLCLFGFHHRRGHLPDHLGIWRSGLVAARHLGDPAALSLAHRRLGQACSRAGSSAEAFHHLSRALALTERSGDVPQQAHTNMAIAVAWGRQGADHHALVHAERALRQFQTLPAPVWQAQALNAVGWYHARLGDYERGRSHCERALDLQREHGDGANEAISLDSLGFIAHRTGRHECAVCHYEDALARYRELGNSYQEADTLMRLGDAYEALARAEEARDAYRRARDLYAVQHRTGDAGHTGGGPVRTSAGSPFLAVLRSAALQHGPGGEAASPRSGGASLA